MDDDFDPFSEDEAVEAPVEEPAPKKTTTRKTAKKETPVSDDNNQASGITISHKPSTDYDSALIVIKAGTPTDALGTYEDPNMEPLIEKAAEVDVMVKEKFKAVAPARDTQPSRTPPRNEGPDGVKTCKHGTMQFRSGISKKTGQAWQAYMCPTPQGTPDQCKAEFIRN